MGGLHSVVSVFDGRRTDIEVVRLGDAQTTPSWEVSMRTRTLQWRYLYLLLLSVLLVPQLGAAQQNRDKPLENSDVLAMTKAGIGESVIIAAIKYAPREQLDSNADVLGSLKSAGVGEVVITALAERVNSRQQPTAQAGATHDGSKAVHAHNASDVQLFFGDKPTDPFRELGRVSSGKFGTLGKSRKREAIDDELKKKAAEMGGDAVISITEDFASVSGVVIVFKDK